MSFLFTNPAFWPLLTLVTLPLLIHLFARARPPVHRFSSIEFLQRIARHTQRIRRPRDTVLWLVRTAMILFLVFLFLQPLWFADSRLAAPSEPKTVVVIVDASASMAVLDGAQSRFATACAEANDLLAGLAPGDRANLIWLRAAPEPVFPAPGVNVRHLRALLRDAHVHQEIGRPRTALRAALDMLADTDGRKELYVVSDFQATNWSDVAPTIPRDVHLGMIRVGEQEPENLAITRLHTDPAQPLAGEPVTVFCEIHNYSARPQHTPVYFSMGERRSHKEISLAPWEQKTVLFFVDAASPGAYPVSVHIDEDGFPGDNARYAILHQRPHLRAGILDNDPATADAWYRALDASGFVKPERLQTLDVSGEAYDALLLAGWDGDNAEALLPYLQRGGLILWAPAPDTPAQHLNHLLGGDNVFPADHRFAWETPEPDTPYALRMGDREDPVFAVFADGEFGDPGRGSFQGRLAIPPLASGQTARTLLRYTDDTPALLHWPVDEGRLFLWNVSLQPEISTWAERMEFLPLLCEIVATYRGTHLDRADRHAFEPGDVLRYRPQRDALETDMQLRTPDGRTGPVTRHETVAGTEFRSPPVTHTGIYTWLLHDTVVARQVVNFPADESDLRADTVQHEHTDWVSLHHGRDAKTLREGIPLWRYSLLLLAVCALVEAVILLGGRRR